MPFTNLPTYIYGAGDVGLPDHDYENDRERTAHFLHGQKAAAAFCQLCLPGRLGIPLRSMTGVS